MHAARLVKGDKVLLDDVTLAFFPGAKIGVVGPNGAGKSTLLKMMAGLEHPSNGDARLFPGFTVGLLSQEPGLDETKTVLGNVQDGVAETKALLDEYNEIAEKMATDYSDELLEQMGKLQEQLDHRDAWDLDSQLEQAMDALRCPPPDCRCDRAVRGRAPPGRVVQAAAVPAGPAAAGRAHQPPGRGERAVAGAAPGEVPRDGRGGHPRPVLPGQRGAVDPRAGPGPHVPLRGQLLDLPGDQGVPDQGRGREGRQAAQAAGGGAGVGALQPPGPPVQEPRPAGALRGDGGRGGQAPQAGLRGDPDPAGPPAGEPGGRGLRT